MDVTVRVWVVELSPHPVLWPTSVPEPDPAVLSVPVKSMAADPHPVFP
jgi:hypothetical protein